jgi:hypothetical protein
MARFLRDTWLPTAVFAVLAGLVSNSDHWGVSVFSHVGPPVTAVFLVPFVWRWFVMSPGYPRAGRAAFAGATLAFLILVFPVMVEGAWSDARQWMSGRASGGEASLVGLLFIPWLLAAIVILGALGSGLGSLTALVQRSWAHPPYESRPGQTVLDGAMCGGQIGGLMGPFIAILSTFILPKSILPMLPYVGLSVPILLLEVWLLTIAAGALLGIGWILRWRQIAGAQRHSTSTSRGPESQSP